MFYQKNRGSAVGNSMRNRAVENTSNANNSSYLEMRFLIPKSSAEIIIGPNGSNIKRLHREYCAMLNISGNATSERILTVGGFDVPTMVSMLQDVITGLKLMLSERGAGGTDIVGMLLDETEVNYITCIDDYQLNQILEESGTHIDVFLMCCPQSSDRVIRIRGKPECITRCVASFYQLLEWCPPPVRRQPYNADNAVEELAADYGGYTNMDDRNKQPVDVSCEEAGSNSRRKSWSSDVAESEDKIMAEHSRAPITVRLSIQSSLAGAILGKGGSRLKHIRHESMADIKIDSEMQAAERIITITGTSEEVENAKELLQLCIRHLCIRIK